MIVIWLAACAWLSGTTTCDGDVAACLEQARQAHASGRIVQALHLADDACERLESGAACMIHASWLRGGQAAQVQEGFTGDESPFGKALQRYERACDLGDGRGCWEMGALTLRGTGVPKDLPKAIRWFDRACEAGALDGCVDGATVREGLGEGLDEARAQLEHACESTHGRACTKLGLAYQHGTGGPIDLEQAVNAFDQGCAARFAAGCGLGAIMTAPDGVQPMSGQYRLFLRAGAALFDPMLVDRLMTLGDEDQVLDRLVERGASACPRDPAACATAGRIQQVRGATDAAVADQLAAACDGGVLQGCGWLAEGIRSGAWPQEGRPRATDLESQGCSANLPNACIAWGQALESGDETEVADLVAAKAAYLKACHAGSLEACDAHERLQAASE